jgi:hypothetical protein
MPPRSIWELRIGGVTVDVPRSVGYYGGVAAAVGLGIVEPPLGIFIAGIPVIKALTHRAAPPAIRLVGAILEGGAKPVGGDADAVVRIDDEKLIDEKAAGIVALAERGRAASGRDRPLTHVAAG